MHLRDETKGTRGKGRGRLMTTKVKEMNGALTLKIAMTSLRRKVRELQHR
jgi:hypothetical protein